MTLNKFACTLFCAVLLCGPAMAQRSRLPPIPLRMEFVRGTDGNVSMLNVRLRNVENQPVCISADYAGPARLVLTLPPAQEVAAQGSQTEAPEGCVDLAPGAELAANYDVAAAFPGQSLAQPRLCYSVHLRRGAASEGNSELPLLWSACSQARPQ